MRDCDSWIALPDQRLCASRPRVTPGPDAGPLPANARQRLRNSLIYKYFYQTAQACPGLGGCIR